MNIRKIQSYLHQFFLEEERKDAITGDLIQANDEVVFCRICKSAFLKDSWNYIGKKHCGQAETLKNVPISKPLLLNITIVKPVFITLTNVSTSFEECLKLLSSFNSKYKKVDILLDFSVKRGTQEYSNLIEKTKKRIERDKIVVNNAEVEPLVTPRTLVVIFVIISIIYFIPTDYALFKILPSIIVFFYIIAIIQAYIDSIKEKFRARREISKIKKLSKRKIISLGNLENKFGFKYSITFGIFNHNLVLYFEELQQAIFIELAKVDEVEIKYQADCYILILLKKYEMSSDIEIPLVFSKNSRIIKFLIKLVEAKKGILNPSNILVTNFPINQKVSLQNGLRLYPEITFIQNEYS